jgi:hypothetical protein
MPPLIFSRTAVSHLSHDQLTSHDEAGVVGLGLRGTIPKLKLVIIGLTKGTHESRGVVEVERASEAGSHWNSPNGFVRLNIMLPI